MNWKQATVRMIVDNILNLFNKSGLAFQAKVSTRQAIFFLMSSTAVVRGTLTITTLWANSGDNKLIFF